MVVCAACTAKIPEASARFCPFCGTGLPERPLGEGAQLSLDCGDITLGKVIGRGGMGIVRRGELTYNGKAGAKSAPPHPVAVKLLNPMLRGSDQAEQLFLGEAEALSRLAHPNIVHFFGLSEYDAQLAIVMEFVHGKPLSDTIAEAAKVRANPSQPVIPMVPAWAIYSQLLGALAATHALGIIHRDVKPSNVLVRPDGVVKLTDYGIARLPVASSRSTRNVAAGTGAYMSPEQVTAAPMDPRSDLYASAIVLFEMLTGRTPFEAPERSELQVRLAQLNEAPSPLSSLIPGAPRGARLVLFSLARQGSAIPLRDGNIDGRRAAHFAWVAGYVRLGGGAPTRRTRCCRLAAWGRNLPIQRFRKAKPARCGLT